MPHIYRNTIKMHDSMQLICSMITFTIRDQRKMRVLYRIFLF